MKNRKAKISMKKNSRIKTPFAMIRTIWKEPVRASERLLMMMKMLIITGI